ncbi:Zinc finger protein [Termitomyces sp. J132]|nr:Zinc finger protein [Termitomyces sp. J132]
MKRRVASLPPVSAAVFDNKVLERRAETAIMASTKDFICHICNKVYVSEGAYGSHINSKKHKENEIKTPFLKRAAEDSQTSVLVETVSSQTNSIMLPSDPETDLEPEWKGEALLKEYITTSDQEDERTIDKKIAAARARLSSNHCLFCSYETTSLEDNLNHMSQVHSFFIPDADYLVDISGLITYLGEKIAVGNVCIFCNDKGREFRTLEAVRKHMIDKSHCKIAYDSANDRLEISDFYDFTSSYPDTKLKKKRDNTMKHDDEQEWEDIESGDEIDADDVVDAVASDESGLDSEIDDSIPDPQITYGDSHLELVLPSGARIGHRSMRRYYAQSFPAAPRNSRPEGDPNSGAALVRRLLADKNAALVPRKGGFGAFGSGTEVVKARNRGEAREAGRHVKEFRDQKRREDFKTRVAFIHNSQKHFRDACESHHLCSGHSKFLTHPSTRLSTTVNPYQTFILHMLCFIPKWCIIYALKE